MLFRLEAVPFWNGSNADNQKSSNANLPKAADLALLPSHEPVDGCC